MTEQTQITINIDDLQKKKLFVATPMYGGQCTGLYTHAISILAMECVKYGIDIKFFFIYNESLIQRARNYCVDQFLRSDSTHLLFIDADIGFNFKDAFTLLSMCDENTHPIIAGTYPKKSISWEKVKMAVDKGYGKDNPFELENFTADMVFNPAENCTSFRIDQPLKVKETGTGFMMIDRSVFEKYAKAYPEKQYKPDTARTEHFDGSRDIVAYFDCEIDPVSRRYLSEDYLFCHNAAKIGIDTYICPWMKMGHVGSYTFIGDMSAIAAIEATPTSDEKSNEKFYKKGK